MTLAQGAVAATGRPDTVTILMGLHDGAAHLRDQLDSFLAQSHPHWHLIVSDDRSRDDGPAMVRRFAADRPDRAVRLIDGPARGFAQNFLHLILATGPQTGLVAFSDQDDVWLPQKLTRAVAALGGVPGPALYCARTMICAPDLVPIRPSPVWRRPFGFANALVQNVAAGNTIVLNREAQDLARCLAPAASAAGIIAHDWWLYQIVTGAGGRVIRDDEPVLLYRQHPASTMGRNDTAGAAAARLGKILSGEFRNWIGCNIDALSAAPEALSPANAARLRAFAEARTAHGAAATPRRIALMRRSGIYRQTAAGQAGLWLAALLGRL